MFTVELHHAHELTTTHTYMNMSRVMASSSSSIIIVVIV